MPEPPTREEIRELRDRLGLTQAAFAALIGCSEMAVWHWEKGSRTPTGLYAKAVRALMSQPPQSFRPP